VKATFLSFLLMASQHKSFTYGYGEAGCNRAPCREGISQTASGDLLSRNLPSVAVPIPRGVKLEPQWIGLQAEGRPCTRVKVNDRTAYRLVGVRGFDLSPAALLAITGKISRHWSGKLSLCKVDNSTGPIPSLE